jgi:hypothetical protein
MWASESAKSVWEPRITQVTQYLSEMERVSVLRGRVAIQSVTPSELPGLVQWANRHRLVVSCLTAQQKPSMYAAGESEYRGGEWTMKVAISQPLDAHGIVLRYRMAKDDELGEYLGYPKCCIKFFTRTWGTGEIIDPTWHMLPDGTERETEVFGPDACNILLRWAGIRAVPYMPCSFHCDDTVKFAEEFLLDRDKDPYKWLVEILSWPVEWSALHGIAEIKTPVFKISTRTDATGEKYTIRRRGRSYPVEGARGMRFPYRTVQSLNAKFWEDNGFVTKEAMDNAHQLITEVFLNAAQDVMSVHDLGCGNGLLLKRIGAHLRPEVMLVGIDVDHDKIMRARELTPTYIFMVGDLRRHIITGPKPSLALISANRLLEDRVAVDKVINRFDYLLLYSYNGVTLIPAGWKRICGVEKGQNNVALYRREA